MQLSRCLTVFPDDYDCLTYRGKLYLRMQEYRKAADDFNRCIELLPSKGVPYIGKADCLRSMDKIQEAIETLSKAL